MGIYIYIYIYRSIFISISISLYIYNFISFSLHVSIFVSYVRLGILLMSLCVYVWVVAKSMYTCETGKFVEKPLCFWLYYF